MSTLVLIPTYNERENIAPLVNRILNLPDEFEVLVIDDNSPDGTADIVKKEFAGKTRVHLLSRPGKLGLGTAYTAGFHHVQEHGYGGAITMDADFSHNPDHIPEIHRASKGCDMVIGSRYVRGGATVNWGIARKLISRVANLMAHMVLSLHPADCTSGFRYYHTDTLKKLDYDSIVAEGYSYLVEILFRATQRQMKIVEVPITFEERRKGKSKISRKEIFKALQTIFRLRFSSQEKTKDVAVGA